MPMLARPTRPPPLLVRRGRGAAVPCSVNGGTHAVLVSADGNDPLGTHVLQVRIVVWFARSQAREAEPAERPTGRGVTLTRKAAKNRTRGRKPRSTRTKAKPRVGQGRTSITVLQEELEARTRELAEA